MRFPRFGFSIAACCLASCLFSYASQPKASCTFAPFSAPSGYTLSMVNGIDDSGTVVGELQDSNSQWVAFSRDASGTFMIFNAPNSGMTWFSHRSGGVNVGSYRDNAMPPAMHGLAQQGSDFTTLNYPKATHTWVAGINKSGTVVGNYLKGTTSKGFQLANGKYTAIAHSGAVSTVPEAISDNGTVVGYYTDSQTHGFLWKSGAFTVVDHPKSVYGTELTDVNTSGVIVGNYMSADRTWGFIYQNNTFYSVVYTGAKSASVGGINNSGVIAGQLFYTLKNQPGYTAVCK
jgi:probable HAF family extracellular repeat protein